MRGRVRAFGTFTGARAALLALALVGLMVVCGGAFVAAPELGLQAAGASSQVAGDSQTVGEVVIEDDEVPMASGAEIAVAADSSVGFAQGFAVTASVVAAAGAATALSRSRRNRG